MVKLEQQRPTIVHVSPSNRIVFVCQSCGEHVVTYNYASTLKPCKACKIRTEPDLIKIVKTVWYSLQCHTCKATFNRSTPNVKFCSKLCASRALSHEKKNKKSVDASQ